MPYEDYYLIFTGRITYKAEGKNYYDFSNISLKIRVHAAGLEDAIARGWKVLSVMIGGTYVKDSFTLTEAKVLE